MSWSLKVSNGDLSLNGASFETVSGEAKLVQDFRHYLLTRMGQDNMYPWYGSLIDGGTKPSGQIVESPIASTDWSTVQIQMASEIRRVASSYQRLQMERAERDRTRYNKSTLTMGEVLAAVTNIKFTQNQDTLDVIIFIQSGRDIESSIALSLPSFI